MATRNKEMDMPPVSAQENYPSGLKLTSIMGGLCLAVFLVALDNTIIATCILRITLQGGLDP